MRVAAVIALAVVVSALMAAKYWAFRRPRLPTIARPEEGWLWERHWRRKALVWVIVAIAIVAGIALAIRVPPESDAVVRGALLAPLVIGALLLKRSNRREGIKTPRPVFQHGPPGWEWDPDAATWRPPDE